MAYGNCAGAGRGCWTVRRPCMGGCLVAAQRKRRCPRVLSCFSVLGLLGPVDSGQGLIIGLGLIDCGFYIYLFVFGLFVMGSGTFGPLHYILCFCSFVTI